jgi:hypothetical protein
VAPPAPSSSSSSSDEEEDLDLDNDDGVVDHPLPLAALDRHGTSQHAPKLIDPTAAFSLVVGPPAYLNPEALRQHATVLHASVAHVQDPADDTKKWDTSRMAPKLASDEPVAGVSAAGAVRYGKSNPATTEEPVLVPVKKAAPPPARGKRGETAGEKKDTKDKERAKRAKGQSTHATWKSETEMALRQQYD